MPGLTFRRGPAQYKIRAIQDGQTLVCETGPSMLYSMSLKQFEDEYMSGHISGLQSEGLAVKLAEDTRGSQIDGRWTVATEAERVAATRKFKYIKRLEQFGPIIFDAGANDCSLTSRLKEVAIEFGDSKPPARTSFYYWWKRYAAGGKTIEALLRRKQPTGDRRKSRLSPVVVRLIEDLQRQMLEGTQRTAAEWAAEINSAIDRQNALVEPSKALRHVSASTWNRRKRLLPLADQLRTRMSRDKVAERLRSVDKVEDPSFPLQVVLVDHTRLQINLYDPKTDRLYSEVWLTVMLCRRTRVILAFCLHVARHDGEVAGRCFAMMATPKTRFKEWCPTAVNDWDCWGLPNALVGDNALEFIYGSFGQFCYSMGTNLSWAPAHAPEWKGAIERWNRTIKSQLLSRLVGAVHRPDSDKRSRRPEKLKNALTMEELTAAVGKWVVDHYHTAVQRGIGEPPIQKWRREIVSVYRAAPSSLEDLLVKTGKRVTRELTREGISFERDVYMSDALAELLTRQGPGKVEVVVSETRASSIHVFDRFNETYIRADIANRACSPEFTREQWKQHKATAASHALDVNTEIGRSTTAHLVEETNAAATNKRTATRRAVTRSVRSRGVSSSSVTDISLPSASTTDSSDPPALEFESDAPIAVPELPIT